MHITTYRPGISIQTTKANFQFFGEMIELKFSQDIKTITKRQTGLQTEEETLTPTLKLLNFNPRVQLSFCLKLTLLMSYQIIWQRV